MIATVLTILSLGAIWLTLYAGYNMSIKHFDEQG